MRSTTAIRAGLAAALLAGSPAAAGDPLHRILEATATAAGVALPSRAALTTGCRADLLCSARRLVEVLAPGARLEPVAHPDTDTIRWVETRPSLRIRHEDEALRVEVLRFGRKVVQELAATFARVPAGQPSVLDLRQTRGGRFARMLEVASFFVGPRAAAVALVRAGETTWLDLPRPAARGPRPSAVQIGAGTASAGEVLAALLATHGGATLCGVEPSAGEAALKAVIPVDHDWRLLVERGRIEVTGIDLRDGLHPARGC